MRKKQRSPGKRKLKEGDEMQISDETEAGTRGELQNFRDETIVQFFDMHYSGRLAFLIHDSGILIDP